MIDRMPSGKKEMWKAVLAALFLVILLNGIGCTLRQKTEGNDPRKGVESEGLDENDVLTKTILEKFQAKAYREVIDLVDRHFEKYPLTEQEMVYIHLKASAHLERKETDQAIAAYEAALPMIRKRHNVAQRKFANVFFLLGELYHEVGDRKKAVSFMEEGLTLAPQERAVQMILGEYYIEAGMKERALSHYRELLEGAGLKEEEEVLIRIKLKRLGAAPPEPPASIQELGRQPFYEGFTIRILPINKVDWAIQIEELCPLLESKFLVRCELLEPVAFDEKSILDPTRDQYDGHLILERLKEKDPNPKSSNTLLVALTGKDIFGPKSRFVFSWQNRALGIGVVSSKRFTVVRKEEEPEIISTRRVAIQFISTVANLLGFSRTTKPHCPTSYPDSLDDFLLKSAKLCDQTIAERDEFLENVAGPPGPFDEARLREIERIYEKYSFR